MSRQINLLPPPPKQPLLSAPRALAAVLAWCLLLAMLAWSGSREVDRLREQAALASQEQQAKKMLLQALQTRLGDNEHPHNLAAQIAALAPRTRVAEDLLARLKSGDLGSLDGYGAQLTEFARVPQQGVWVTRLTIGNAGRALSIEGRALRKEQILPYAANLNAAMTKYGIVLKDVEISPMKQSPDEDASATPLWTFRLS